ncbi:alpha/beta hydrolase [Paraburkholderia sp. LEh10]|uniref:alpha/beta fold hydrolase n=1 Tax=Paraburkholderia sp. LEh10 TaxID=2821353 RepID=UPI001AE0EFC6|nr:alpha/beta hydrolase [Paraburkholderia sp. LEh10]MBP0595695.1 alpha/beta hydrolase [Paraburkholderia sp. LEh10]
MTLSEDPPLPEFIEHHIPRAAGHVYVRDFANKGPAFVLLHGFPDDAHIYDLLIPRLVSAGRRVVAVDFLGFGASDKPEGAQYSFRQQLGDIETVVEALGLELVIPVGHDAGGPAAVNFALNHPTRTSKVVLMNAFYGSSPGLRVPELIELFSNRELRALAQHFLQSPLQFAWLIDFQRNLLQAGLSDEQKVHYFDFLGPIIDNNFRQQPSAASAFAQMTSQLHEEVAANTARLVEFRRSDIPLLLIWGKADPYLHLSVAQHMHSQARNASLHALDAGHWPQIDAADEVAQLMLEAR